MAKSPLNESKSEVIERNFLEENPDIPLEQKVVVAKEVPKMETVVFLNNRDPGITLNFHYASKTHPLKHYDLIHGQTYTLPVEVINHLEGQNKHDPYACHSRIYGRRMRQDGKSETFVNSYVPYFQCKTVRA
jgi:hypothetical protein